jgi:hypothetical protein
VLQPNGPLPAAVYWRRRVLAAAVLIAVIAALIWLVAAVAGHDDAQRAARLAGAGAGAGDVMWRVPQAAGDSASPTAASLATSPDPSQPPGGAAPYRFPAALAADSAGGAPRSYRPGDGALGAPAPRGRVNATNPPGLRPPLGPPPACPDQVTAVAAQPERPEYEAGARPVFRFVVTNTGRLACTRDLDPGLQELLVFAADGATRVWSSNDCYPGGGVDVRLLRPGETVAASLTWSGRSSHPGCAGQRVPVPAGDYVVVARLGQLTSPPTRFHLIP